jgi:RimJ/RimL family protein N-acetyltransferase
MCALYLLSSSDFVHHTPLRAVELGVSIEAKKVRNESIEVRPATIQDAEMLLQWRNDPETRSGSHNSAEVEREEHIVWLTKTLNDKCRRLFVAEENGVPVGTVRVDLADGAYQLSWTVAPNARGRGVAKRMVALLASETLQPIRAEIRTGNAASIRVAEYAGMTYHGESEGVLHYRRAALK